MSEKEIFLAKEFGSEIKFRPVILKIFKNLDKFSKVIMNFEGVNHIGIAAAHEYVLQKAAADFEIVEINISDNIQGMFDIAIPFLNQDSVRVRAQLNEIESHNELQYKYNKFHLAGLRKEVTKTARQLKAKKEELVKVNDELEIQKLGLYEPNYVFDDFKDYKKKLLVIRNKQKEMISKNRAVVSNKNIEITGDKLNGTLFLDNIMKLMVRTFNIESESIINNVNYLNRLNSIKRLEKSFDDINDLNKMFGVSLSPNYFYWKLKELNLIHDFKLKASEIDDDFAEDGLYHNVTLQLPDGSSYKFLIKKLTKDEWYQCKNRPLNSDTTIERFVCEKALLTTDKKHIASDVFDVLPIETIEAIFTAICDFSGIWP